MADKLWPDIPPFLWSSPDGLISIQFFWTRKVDDVVLPSRDDNTLFLSWVVIRIGIQIFISEFRTERNCFLPAAIGIEAIEWLELNWKLKLYDEYTINITLGLKLLFPVSRRFPCRWLAKLKRRMNMSLLFVHRLSLQIRKFSSLPFAISLRWSSPKAPLIESFVNNDVTSELSRLYNLVAITLVIDYISVPICLMVIQISLCTHYPQNAIN